MFRIKIYLLTFIILSIINNGLKAQTKSGWFYQQSPVSSYFNDVKFTDVDNGIIVGTSGTILKTTNSGNNWISKNSGTSIDLNSISIASSSEYYIAGDSGKVLKSTDEGNTWITLNKFNNNNLRAISFKNNIGFVAGDKGTLMRTTNSGLNWAETFSDTSIYFKSISFINETFIWVIGQKIHSTGEVYLLKSTNSGNSWVNYGQQLVQIYVGNSINFLDTLNGYCGHCNTTLYAGVLRTTNGGETWECSDGSIHDYPISISFINTLTGFSIGQGDYPIYKTINGVDWYTSLAPDLFEFLNSSHFVNPLTGWAVGSKILKTINGGELLTNLITTSENIPSEFSLSQNYPNPFNPNTKIGFDISKTAFTKLSVYNSEGRKIESLVDENLKEGSYEITFDGRNYPSGVYYYRLATNGYSFSKKMLLLK